MEIYPLVDPYAVHYDTFAGDVYTLDTASITLTAGTLTAGSCRVNVDGSDAADYLSVGASDDLRIYHDGSSSYIQNAVGSGNLYLWNEEDAGNLVFQTRSGVGNLQTITWVGNSNRLTHSLGEFDFDDDNILTTGTISDGVLTISDGSITSAVNGTFSGTGTFGNITIFNPTPILVLKDSTYAGDTSLGYIEWRDSNNTRLGFFGNASSGDDDLYWKNESSGGHIKIETTGAGECQILANTAITGTLGAGATTVTSLDAGSGTIETTGTINSRYGVIGDSLSASANTLLTVGDETTDTGDEFALDVGLKSDAATIRVMDFKLVAIPTTVLTVGNVAGYTYGIDTNPAVGTTMAGNKIQITGAGLTGDGTQITRGTHKWEGIVVDITNAHATTYKPSGGTFNLRGLRIDGEPSNYDGATLNFTQIYLEDAGSGWGIYSEGGDSSHAGNFRIGSNVAPTVALSMGDDALIAFDVNAGLTASTTQSQGQGALTAQVNEISTVANDDDTVTLPSAITGIRTEIINNGANTLQIFPASGDDLGLGVNAAEELEANERVGFVAYDTTNWAKESSTEIIHAEIHDEDNTDAFVINDAGGDFHSYHTNGLAAGDLADWAFDAGGAGTSHAITGIAQAGSDITVTTGDAHGLSVGDIISQTNLTDAAYVGVFDVLTVPTTTTYTVTATYTATGTGTMDQAATLEADAVAAGVYSFAYCISGTSSTNNETVDFQLHKEATAVVGSKVRRKFGTASDFGAMSGCGVVTIASGDKISLALSNEDSAGNITLRNFTLVLIRL